MKRLPRRMGTAWRAAVLASAIMLVATFAAAAETVDLSGQWKFKADWKESGLAEGWQKPDFDDSKWNDLNVPGAWEDQGVTTPNPNWPSTEKGDGYNGFAWYRRHLALPDTWTGEKVRIRLGVIDDLDWVYINGKLIGQTTKAAVPYPGPARGYDVPAGVLKPGDNVVAVRVSDTGGKGGILEGPVELTWEQPLVTTAGAAPASPPAPAAPAAARTYTTKRGGFTRVGDDVYVPEDMEVQGDVVAVFSNADVEGRVTGSVVAVGGSVNLRSTAIVDGGATAVGGTVAREDGSVISGQTAEVPVLPNELLNRLVHRGADPFHGPGWIGGLVSRLLLAAFVVLLAVLLLPQRMEVMARALPASPGWAATYGILGIVLAPAVFTALAIITVVTIVVLCITVIGILAVPAVAVALAGAILAIIAIAVLGIAAVWLSLGRAILHQSRHSHVHTAWAMLLGMFVIYLLGSLPHIGPLVAITVLIFGFGIALYTGIGSREDWAQHRFGWGHRGPAPAGPSPSPAGNPGTHRVVVRSHPVPETPTPAPEPPAPEAGPDRTDSPG